MTSSDLTILRCLTRRTHAIGSTIGAACDLPGEVLYAGPLPDYAMALPARVFQSDVPIDVAPF